MKRTAFLLALIFWGFTPHTSAQNGVVPAGGISVAKILDGYLTATGGLNAHKELTLRATGDFGFILSHPLGNYAFSYKAPATDVLEIQMVSHGTSWFGRRDGHRIHRGTVEGVGMINGAGMGTIERCMASLVEWDIRDYNKIELIGRAQVEKRWTYAVRFTPKQGDPSVRYYDMENFLMLRIDQVQRFRKAKSLPEVAYALTTYMRDYRQFGAVKLPHEIAVRRELNDLLFELQSVKTGVEIPDSEFRD